MIVIDIGQLGALIGPLIQLTTASLVAYTAWRTNQVHTAVNGISKASQVSAELAGYSRGAGTTPPPAPPAPPSAP